MPSVIDKLLGRQGEEIFFFDDETQTAGIRDDWFGLRPGESYTMTWAIYATDTPDVFDLVNLLRDDWLEPFTIHGGINFFEPDAILAYDDEALRAHLELLNINIMMSQPKRHKQLLPELVDFLVLNPLGPLYAVNPDAKQF